MGPDKERLIGRVRWEREGGHSDGDREVIGRGNIWWTVIGKVDEVWN